MTPSERKAAAEVMASDGPWSMRERFSNSSKWRECLGEPGWNWEEYEYIVRQKSIVRYIVVPDVNYGFPNAMIAKDKAGCGMAVLRIEFLPGQFDE